jgi:predicted AlkP superfamily pyrophosphatase or phosphodiesterase
MAKNHERWLVVQVAALGWDLVRRHADRVRAAGWSFHPAESVFPALTGPVQATLRTATPPSAHGLWSNGLHDRALAKTLFWEQSAALVSGPRVWADARAAGRRAGLLFFQQSLGESVDFTLSPKPVHRHHGGMIPDCLDRPSGLYARLCAEVGGLFPLHRYWGPMAGAGSTRWIVAATQAVMAADDLAPEILFAYVPHLDYDLQRHGPDSPQAVQALDETLVALSNLRMTARARGYRLWCFGDYAIAPVTRPPVFLNRLFREAGLMSAHAVRGRLYPDFYHSAAVAVCDHEIAPVYVRDPSRARAVRATVSDLPGVAEVRDVPGPGEGGGPARRPDFIAVAEEGSWFAYPWWASPREAPDYARHIDIHNKPGYDPCELFWGWPPPGVSTDPGRVRGTHGRAGPDRAVAVAIEGVEGERPVSLADLAVRLGSHLGFRGGGARP